MADTYRAFEINGIANPANVDAFRELINELWDGSKVSVGGVEWTPVAGNPELAQNTVRVNFGGPNLNPFLATLRAEILDRYGKVPDVDELKTADLDEIKTAWQTYGDDLENREALQTELRRIWREGARCMTGEDSRTLKRWLNNYGFADLRDFKEWLNERPF